MTNSLRRALPFVLLLAALRSGAARAEDDTADPRPPANDAELRYWLESMIWHHRLTTEEVSAATGLDAEVIAAAAQRWDILPGNRPPRAADAPLLVLPYPGGRHPRTGFRDGAIRPQRDTKVSVFAPWDADRVGRLGYVVADVPEALWSNLGLTYLAHTHVPTVWSQQGIELERREWTRNDDGTLEMSRTLPNGIAFGTRVLPGRDAVRMEMWLTNGTAEALTDLRVQQCAMLRGAAGFEEQTNDNKVFRGEYACCRDSSGRRWVITAWTPGHRTWGNAPCPCLHSDPRFPDCPAGETRHLRGWLSFYEGDDIEAELRRIDALDWRAGATAGE